MTNRIDLWEIILNGTNVSIDFMDDAFVVNYLNEKHLFQLKEIKEIGMYKMDHMTHDTIMMYFKFDEIILEIPFEIEIQTGELSESVFQIKNYSWSCRIKNGSEFVEWLVNNLKGFDKKWLNCSEPLLDSPSHIINYLKK